MPMKVYKNLEDIEVEDYDKESPRKNRSTNTSSSSMSFKTDILTKYYEDLNYYDPFSYEFAHELEERKVP